MREAIARWPLGVRLLCVVVLAIATRALAASIGELGAAGAEEAPPRLAFWNFIVLAASWVWRGIEVITAATVQALQISITILWGFARTIWNGVRDVGSLLARGLRAGWDLLRATYEHVLKPAWSKFWTWFDRARRWLEDIFRPVFRWIERVRKWVLELYDKHIRPLLDIIGFARRVLRVLAALGADWARALDRVLAELERRIDGAFRVVLAKINEVIGVLNRIVTADGLFQRLALLRSIERDFTILRQQWYQRSSRELTPEERRRRQLPEIKKTPEEHAAEAEVFVRQGGGRLGSRADEVVIDLRRLLTIRTRRF